MHDVAAAGRAPWFVRHESWIVLALGVLAFVSIPLSLGYLGLSWDAVNHHFYLGWVAAHPRFDRDFVAAAYQSYQFPYLYWPVYKLAMMGASGTTAGVVLALLHATAIPAVWLIARACIPGEDLFGAAMRGAGVALAFMSGAVLSMFDTTANDLLAAVPLLWAYALALRPIADPRAAAFRWILGSALCGGVAVAFKLSNGFLAIALPLLWIWPAGHWTARVGRVAAACMCICASFALTYGIWGWQLWVHYGNPLYPLYDDMFAPVREMLGVAPMMIRFQPDTILDALLRYFNMVAPDANVYMEIPAPDIRFAAIAVLVLGLLVWWRKLAPGRAPVIAMVVVLFASTAVWLRTTGNGRYFMAMLVAAGPIVIALVYFLPLTRAFRAALAVLLLAVQGFLLTQQTPWNSWALMHWTRAPYFDVRLGPEELRAPPTTYASLSLLSYSLIAPQFPAESRWINAYAMAAAARDEHWTDDFLRQAAAQGPVKVIAPSIPSATLPNGLPDAAMLAALDKLVAARNLHISGECRLITSPGLLLLAEREKKPLPPGIPLGFWTCPVAYEARSHGPDPIAAPQDVLAAFQKMGQLCPRFFPPQEAMRPSRLKDGWTVHYGTETRLYVMDGQDVWYQFWRNYNGVRVGTIAEVLSGRAVVDCGAVRSDGAWRTGAE